jgi:hypothetical protein
MYLVDTCGMNTESWKRFFDEVDAIKSTRQSKRSLLIAVTYCWLARSKREKALQEWVLEQLVRRTGWAPVRSSSTSEEVSHPNSGSETASPPTSFAQGERSAPTSES